MFDFTFWKHLKSIHTNKLFGDTKNQFLKLIVDEKFRSKKSKFL